MRGSLKLWQSSFLGLLVFGLGTNLLMLVGPMFMLQIYDRVLPSRSMPTLVTLVCLVVALYAYYSILDWLRARALIRVSQRFGIQWSRAAFDASVRRPLAIGSKSDNDAPIDDLERIRSFLSGPGPLAILDMPWMPAFLALVFLLHPLLGWLAILGALVTILLLALQEILSRGPSRDTARVGARRALVATHTRQNAETVMAMGMLDRLGDRWTAIGSEYLDAQAQTADRMAMLSSATRAWRLLLQSAVLALGAWLVISQEVTPGVMIAASILVSRALAPIEQAIGQWRNFVAARQSVGRLSRVLEHMQDEAPGTDLPLPKNTLQVIHVHAAAPGTTSPLLQDINFALKAGDGLGIIGLSGSGKTSLVRVLTGVWSHIRGEVRLDGSTYGQWSAARLGTAIGYLPQTVDLFDGTIAENIARFDPNADSRDVLEAAQLAGVHKLVTKFTDGFDTRVGSGGIELSAGQRQRIGLARALYRSPFLIVLDEPNSNLDGDGEAALHAAIAAIRAKGSIVIIVAHRASAISSIDLLLLLQDGRQVRFGPRQQVLKALGATSGTARGPSLNSLPPKPVGIGASEANIDG
ncbi:type I secretion system permease/ATPase [Devosia yakushimensis]|nr:type I secretion system permease/ATPase [Devosia yakushimensis]